MSLALVQLSLTVGIFLAILVYFVYQIKKYPLQHKNILSFLDRTDYLLLIVISCVYAGISFINLGNILKPNTPVTLTARQGVEINFTTPTHIDQFYYALGYVSGSIKFSYVRDDNQTQSITIDPGTFMWNHLQLNDPNAKYKKFTLAAESGVIELRQLALFNNIDYVTGFSLTQAQHMIPKRRLVSVDIPQNYQSIWHSSSIWDEYYYVTTAYQFNHHLPALITVHPPLGMWLISLGMRIFGDNSLGWRIVPDLAGILSLLLVYLFTKKLTLSRSAAIIASILFGVDFMHFMITRMASLESTLAFFAILSIFFLYCYAEARRGGEKFDATHRYLLPCALSIALAMSIKWSAIYSLATALLVIVYFEFIYSHYSSLRVKLIALLKICALFVVLPISFYFTCYYPTVFYPFYKNSGINNFWSFVSSLQPIMYRFHTEMINHVAHGGGGSQWWQWPLITQPQLVYRWLDTRTSLSSLGLLMGNPLIWWMFYPSLLFMLINVVKTRKFMPLFFLFITLMQFLPYALFGRISYIYYFYISSIFGIIMLSYLFSQVLQLKNKRLNYLIIGYVIACILLFAAFYPLLSGLLVDRTYFVKYLLWYHNWQFL
ncbi:MAG: phospholipid carrier-dependent glycosyltransferase [Neisseriaceae bacterium]|nr:MAG: phospholipid carrier-dependent glycosyltransferase [Neisseriaceae bacterium]